MALLSVDEYLTLTYSNILKDNGMVKAHFHFNVITHFLAQCGSGMCEFQNTTTLLLYDLLLLVDEYLKLIHSDVICAN